MINKRYEQLLEIYNTQKGDLERKALLYIIGRTDDIFDHKESVYSFQTHKINPRCLSQAWVTGNNRCLLLLAFNLFNGFLALNEKVKPTFDYPTVYYILQNLDPHEFNTAMNAIKIRFNRM